MLALGKAECEQNVIAFDIACLLQALTKCAQTLRERCSSAQKPNHRHRRLLRTRRRQRPHCCRAAGKQCNELATFHSITSSATASSLSGTVRPSSLAVWALMTSSNLVDCTTGKSTGLVPLEDTADIDADLTKPIHQ